jgi:hypothetical protein
VKAAKSNPLTHWTIRAGAVLLLGLIPWPGLDSIFSQAFRSVANGTLGLVSLETKLGTGRVGVIPADTPISEGLSWDTLLILRIESVPNTEHVYVNPRRIAWIPSVLYLSLLIAAPLTMRERVRCIAAGLPVLWGVAIAGLWVTALWLFARTPELLVDWTQTKTESVELAYRALVVPLGNRYVFAIFLALVQWSWSSARRERTRLRPRPALGERRELRRTRR